MLLYKREKYLKKIRPFFHDEEMIKVITGVRRCGKSCIMKSIAQELEAGGVSASNIIYIDLDKKENMKVETPDQLEALIDFAATSALESELKYLFIDEVQNVKNFEPLINGYHTDGGWSIFLTGSNAYLLSGELVTKLTGRYLEFEIFTLGFDEYLAMKKMYKFKLEANPDSEFSKYILTGGFPGSLAYEDDDQKRVYVEGIIEEIFEKDIRQRTKIRNVSVFNTVRDYLINNYGATISVTNLLNYFNKVEHISIKRETLNRYIQILVDAKILYRCQRFDMKSRRSLSREEKYYLADLGFYFARNTDNRINYGPSLENIVYCSARAKGYAVSVGKIGSLECDFVLRKSFEGYSYVQVAMTIAQPSTEDREFASLEKNSG